MDNIDIEECNKRKIKIITSPGANANSVAEFFIGLIILLLRNFFRQNLLLKNKKWRSKMFIGKELKNKIIGIIDCGAMEKLLAQKFQAFEVKKILGFDLYLSRDILSSCYKIEKISLNNLLINSDVITLHLPLTLVTKNLIIKKELTKMKKIVI